MTFFSARTLAISTVAFVLALLPCSPQNSSSAPPAQTPVRPTAPDTQTHGQVIFSRSTDENGQTSTEKEPAKANPAFPMAKAPSVEDADRQSIAITDLDLDVRLRSESKQLVTRALVTVRNTGKSPLPRIPLQISSSLNWERIRVAGKDISCPIATLNSDADHTGQLHEAAVPLTEPLAPGATLQLDVTYSGIIAASSQRLLAIGTPEDAALHSDWDQISVPFTGLRGFGNVVWYPVSSVPVILGDGARLFDEIGKHKLRLSGTTFRLSLTVEFPHGHPPSIALVNGRSVPLTIADAPGLNPDVAGVATGASDSTTLGFEAPSLFVATRTPHPGANLTAWTLPEHAVTVKSWLAAAESVTPFEQRWLGQSPRTQLTLLDLPDPDDAPWETGALFAVSLRDEPPAQLDTVLVHALAHAYLGTGTQPTPEWFSEGAAYFLGSLWVEKQQGRDQALAMLEGGRSALALAEPASPGDGSGQPLATAIAPVFYRTKAAYVFWMLRYLAGDDGLAAALRVYDTGHNQDPAGGSNSFEKLLQGSGAHRDLNWFFADWIYADKGLPDLSIEKVFPNAVQSGNWLVSVSVANAGYAAAEVPIVVRSATATTAERVLIPARGSITQRLLVQGKPTEVQLNDGTVPETQASIHNLKLD